MNKEKVEKIEEEQLDNAQGGCLINPTYPVPQEFTNGVGKLYKDLSEK